jgi:predicted ester cyclase
MIAEGDKVVIRGTWGGTHSMLRKQVTGTMIVIQRFKGGKLAEVWSIRDRLDEYEQLGIIKVPPMGQGGG